MNIAGKWKVAKVMGMNEDFDRIWMNEEEYKASPSYNPEDEDRDAPFKTALYFNEDHTVDMLAAIPAGLSQSEIDEAVASGEVTIIDGMMLVKEKDPMKWKEENGKLYINTKDSDNPDGVWNELTVEDGLIELLFYKLEKVD